jgi:hypothetical protein
VRITQPCARTEPGPRAWPAAMSPLAGPRPAGPGTGSARPHGLASPMGSYPTQAGVRSRGSNTEHRRSTRSMPLMLADGTTGPAARQAAAPRPPKAAVPGGRGASAADRTVRSRGGSAAGGRERHTGHRVRGPDRCRNLRRSHDVGPGHARAFGPRCPSLAPCSVNIVCEMIEGAGPNGVPGETRSREERLRGRTAARRNSHPKDLIRGNAGEARPPRRHGVPGADSGGSQECVRSRYSAAALTLR